MRACSRRSAPGGTAWCPDAAAPAAPRERMRAARAGTGYLAAPCVRARPSPSSSSSSSSTCSASAWSSRSCRCYAEQLGASEASTGWLSTGYSLMQFVFAPIWGRLSDRVGRRPVLLVSIAMTAVAFGLYALAAPSFRWLLVSRLFAGRRHRQHRHRPGLRGRRDHARGPGQGHGHHRRRLRPRLRARAAPSAASLSQHVALPRPGFAAAALAAVNGVAAFFILRRAGAPDGAGAAPGAVRRAGRGAGQARDPPAAPRLLPAPSLAFSAMEATFALLAEDALRPLRPPRRLRLRLHRRPGGGGAGRPHRPADAPLRGEAAARGWASPCRRLALRRRCPSPAGTLRGLLAATAPLAVGQRARQPGAVGAPLPGGRAEDQGGTLGIGRVGLGAGADRRPASPAPPPTTSRLPTPTSAARLLMAVAAAGRPHPAAVPAASGSNSSARRG